MSQTGSIAAVPKVSGNRLKSNREMWLEMRQQKMQREEAKNRARGRFGDGQSEDSFVSDNLKYVHGWLAFKGKTANNKAAFFLIVLKLGNRPLLTIQGTIPITLLNIEICYLSSYLGEYCNCYGSVIISSF